MTSVALRQIALIGVAVVGCWAALNIIHLSPLLVLAAALVAAGCIIASLRPQLAIGLLVLSFFFGEAGGGFTLTQGLGLLALAVGFAAALVRKETFELGNLFPWLIAWALWLCSSFLYSVDKSLVMFHVRAFMINVAIYVLIIHYFRSSERFRRVNHLIFAAMLINALVAIWQWVQSGGSIYFRAEGVHLDTNYLGSMCVVGAGIAAIESLMERRFWTRMLWVCGGVICILGMLSTASRTAHVCMLALGGCLFIWYRKQRVLIAATAAVLLLLFPFAPIAYRQRVHGLGEKIVRSLPGTDVRNLTTRGYLFEAGLRIWRDHPIVGAGVGTFQKLFRRVGYNPGIRWGSRFVPHNAYIGLLAETGAVGLSLYAIIIIIAVRNMLIAVRRSRVMTEARRAAVLECAFLLITHLIMTMSIPVLTGHSFFMAMAATVICARRDEG